MPHPTLHDYLTKQPNNNPCVHLLGKYQSRSKSESDVEAVIVVFVAADSVPVPKEKGSSKSSSWGSAILLI